MRTALVAALLVGLSATAGAQSRTNRSHDSTDEVWRPSIGLPLPQIGLPLPPIGLQPLERPERSERLERSERPERPERFERSERPERPERFERSGGSVIFFGPMFGWPYLAGTPVPTPPSPPAPPYRATGTLHLDVRSGVDPQIYVDGYYVGLLSDANGGDLTLDAGGHTLELREDGYETLREQVRVPFDGVITYRAELKLLDRVDLPIRGADLPGPRAEAPPPAPTTIYLIPGCYVGNVPPKDAALPAGCDARDAVEFPSR